jgi:hypothetical protein
MGTITKKIQQLMERLRQKQMQLDELPQPGWEDAVNYFCEREKKYGTSELRVQAVVQPPTDDDAATPAPTTFGELMECLEIVPGISQMPQGTTRPGSSYIRLSSVKPHRNTSKPGLEPAVETDLSPVLKAKTVEPVCFYLCI